MRRAFSKKNLWERLPPRIKELSGLALGLVPPKFLLGKAFDKWAHRIVLAESWGRDEVHDYQVAQLRSILQLCYKGSSYYRREFDESGFSPSNLSDLSELEKIPLIDKHVINDHADELLVVPQSSSGIDYVSTGGSSGEPLRFLIGSDRSSVEYAHLVNAWLRVGYRLDIPQAVFRGMQISPNKAGMRHYYDPLLRRHYYSTFHMTDDTMREYLDHVKTVGPCFLHVYPSSLNMLVRFAKRTGYEVPANIEGILSGSENVYREDRAVAEATFGARYFSWYGHSEKLVFAAECEFDERYHVSPTYGYFELVDDEGRRITEPGRRGEIVGTGFINKVMPFVRYRTGDFATYEGDHCPQCGRYHTLISNVSGHNTLEMLVARDNSLIPWAAVNVHGDTFENVLQFQFFQDEPGQAVLRLVPASTIDQIDTARISRDMEAKLKDRVDFEIEIVDRIPLTKHGKSVFVDQKLDTEKILVEG